MATQIAPADSPVIRAAGGIIQRTAAHGDEVMLVFRKREQEWTLPKGEVREDESFQEAALREVELETGCACRLGSYLGTISYSDNGVPKVVMFWKMAVTQEKPGPASDEIGEVAWIPVAAAIERLGQPQERAILSRLASTPRAQQAAPAPAPVATPGVAAEPATEAGQRPKRSRIEDGRVYARLLRESEAFRVELAFLERRSGQADKTWASTASEQLNNVARCLESNDVEGGLFCLHAARRFAVYGLTKAELITRGYVLREEAQKISSWRGNAIDGLLAVPDEDLTADRLAEAMALRDEETTNQYYKVRLTGDHLRILLIICGLAMVALLPFMLMDGPARTVAPVLLFGLLGSSFAAAHSLMRGKNESRIPNVFIMLTPVLFGAVAGLAGFATFEYVAWLLNVTGSHTAGVLALAFLFGMLAQRILARLAGTRRRKKLRS
ncbi:MAG TPA: NUDIX hydrolase [Candidatus Angelobacter sp.]